MIQTASQHEVRGHQVTLVQVSWTEYERGAPGALTLQLLVDEEPEEVVVRAAPADAALLLDLLAHRSAPVPVADAEPLPTRRWAEASFMRT